MRDGDDAGGEGMVSSCSWVGMLQGKAYSASYGTGVQVIQRPYDTPEP